MGSDIQTSVSPVIKQACGPNLSVLVPVYNSADKLVKCLAALRESRYSRFEVLVVDDGSTEAIQSIVSSFGFRYMRIKGPGGPARARNRGVAHVDGDYLVFVDADVCVKADTLGLFAERFAADPKVDAIVGCYDDSPADPGFVSQYKNLFHHYVHQSCDGPINTFWSGCGAIRRDLFIAFGGFDERRYRRPAIEDIELGTWLSAAGHTIVLDKRIVAKHLKRWTFWNLIKTDIFDRGVPWTRLMLRAGAMANTLNVKPAQRASVALAYLAGLSTLAAGWFPIALFLAAALAFTVTALNVDFYRYVAVRAGFGFAVRVVPMHWLYFGYCGFSLLLGSLYHYFDRSNEGRPSIRRSGSDLGPA